MAGYFGEEFIKRVVDNTDIISIISPFVALKRSGNRYKGLCPFHNEKTPSFTVTPDKNLYYCFGCGAHGDVITFVMETQKLTFTEAIEYLADLAGIPLEYTTPQVEDKEYEKKKILKEILKDTANFYYKILVNTEFAYKYLLSRGLKKETIKTFGLGYASDGNDLFKYLLGIKKYHKKYVIEAGVVKVNARGNFYDYFYNRIIFPIQDVSGNVIAFGGRIFNKEKDKNLPKYLNTPESPVFVKNSTLFNLNRAKRLLRDKPLILVEGYMDVISLYDKGVENVAATLGTAFNVNHAKLIGRYTKNVVILYDGDEAGRKATLKAADILESVGIYPKILRLPIDEDPDSYILKYSVESFEKLIKSAVDSTEYKLNEERKKYDIYSSYGKMEYIKGACRIISEIKDEVRKDVYLKKISSQTQVSEDLLFKQINGKALNNHMMRGIKDKDSSVDDVKKINPITKKILMCENYILKYIIENPNEISIAEEVDIQRLFSGEIQKELLELLINEKNKSNNIDIDKIMEYNKRISAIVSMLASLDENISRQEMNECVEFLKINDINRKMETIKRKINDIEQTGNKLLLDELIAEFYRLKAELLNAKSGGRE